MQQKSAINLMPYPNDINKGSNLQPINFTGHKLAKINLPNNEK